MELSEDRNTVKIVGECSGHKVRMEISILQLAKIFGTDREVGDECERIGFGSVELEDKCAETRELIKKFPDVKVWERKIEFTYVRASARDEKSVDIYAEDLVGWSNEGLRIDFPKEIFDSELKGKFRVFATPFSVKLKPERIAKPNLIES